MAFRRSALAAVCVVACCAMIALVATGSAGALRTTTRTVLDSVSSFVHKGLDLDTAQTVLSRAPSLSVSVSKKMGLDLETAQATLTQVLSRRVQALKDEQEFMLAQEANVSNVKREAHEGEGVGGGLEIEVEGSHNTIALGGKDSHSSGAVVPQEGCGCCGQVGCGCCAHGVPQGCDCCGQQSCACCSSSPEIHEHGEGMLNVGSGEKKALQYAEQYFEGCGCCGQQECGCCSSSQQCGCCGQQECGCCSSSHGTNMGVGGVVHNRGGVIHIHNEIQKEEKVIAEEKEEMEKDEENQVEGAKESRKEFEDEKAKVEDEEKSIIEKTEMEDEKNLKADHEQFEKELENKAIHIHIHVETQKKEADEENDKLEREKEEERQRRTKEEERIEDEKKALEHEKNKMQAEMEISEMKVKAKEQIAQEKERAIEAIQAQKVMTEEKKIEAEEQIAQEKQRAIDAIQAAKKIEEDKKEEKEKEEEKDRFEPLEAQQKTIDNLIAQITAKEEKDRFEPLETQQKEIVDLIAQIRKDMDAPAAAQVPSVNPQEIVDLIAQIREDVAGSSLPDKSPPPPPPPPPPPHESPPPAESEKPEPDYICDNPDCPANHHAKCKAYRATFTADGGLVIVAASPEDVEDDGAEEGQYFYVSACGSCHDPAQKTTHLDNVCRSTEPQPPLEAPPSEASEAPPELEREIGDKSLIDNPLPSPPGGGGCPEAPPCPEGEKCPEPAPCPPEPDYVCDNPDCPGKDIKCKVYLKKDEDDGDADVVMSECMACGKLARSSIIEKWRTLGGTLLTLDGNACTMEGMERQPHDVPEAIEVPPAAYTLIPPPGGTPGGGVVSGSSSGSSASEQGSGSVVVSGSSSGSSASEQGSGSVVVSGSSSGSSASEQGSGSVVISGINGGKIRGHNEFDDDDDEDIPVTTECPPAPPCPPPPPPPPCPEREPCIKGEKCPEPKPCPPPPPPEPCPEAPPCPAPQTPPSGLPPGMQTPDNDEIEDCNCPPVPECKQGEPCPEPAPCAPCPGVDKVADLEKDLEWTNMVHLELEKKAELEKEVKRLKADMAEEKKKIEEEEESWSNEKAEFEEHEEEEKRIWQAQVEAQQGFLDAQKAEMEKKEMENKFEAKEEEDKKIEKTEEAAKKEDIEDHEIKEKEDEKLIEHEQMEEKIVMGKPPPPEVMGEPPPPPTEVGGCHCECEHKEPQQDPKPKECPCCKVEVALTLEIPISCADFSLEAQTKFKCAIAAAGGLCGEGSENGACEGPKCESVSIPSLDCGPEEEPPEEDKEDSSCSCCDDHARRRLLWAGTACLCCKTKSHATWSARRRLLTTFGQKTNGGGLLQVATSGSTKVDVSVEITSSKAAQVIADLSNPAKINDALQAAGLPAVTIVEAPKVFSAPPPLSKDWPHHDAQLWKERVHSTREDDVLQDIRKAKLERLGVKVNSFLTRAIPLPVFDETQWDHYMSHAGRNQVMDLKERLASDVGLHVLKKAGVAVDASPITGGFDTRTVRDEDEVHTLFGLQTDEPYFIEGGGVVEHHGNKKQSQALIKAGVNIGDI